MRVVVTGGGGILGTAVASTRPGGSDVVLLRHADLDVTDRARTLAAVRDARLAVVLGDNLLQRTIRPSVERFRAQARGARILLKEVPDPERFGVAQIDGQRVVSIVEKPDHPKSNLAVTGIYFYDSQVFEVIRTLKPSGRGELEITDVNNAYVKRGTLTYDILDGWWTDAGTFDSLYRANKLVLDTPEMH